MSGRRSERRAARIREEVPIEDLLSSYGYAVQAADRQQQFSCDLHGDGRDGKPSARVYPESNHWYCWACSRSRDAIATVREKEGLGFVEALAVLEARYHLPPLPWEEGDHEAAPKDPVAEILDAVSSDPIGDRSLRLLRAYTAEKSLPLRKVTRLWEAYDRAKILEERGDAGPMRSVLNILLELGRSVPQ